MTVTLPTLDASTPPGGPRSAPTVLQVLPRLVSGGVERGTIEVAAALVRAGFRAVVASQGGPMVRELDRAGARHVTLPLGTKNPIGLWRNVDRLTRLIEAEGIDLVHARSRAPAWSAHTAARRAGVPFVTTVHGTYGQIGPLKRVYNGIMARGDRVIAISEFIGERVRTTYGVDEARLRVIHRGVDLDAFDPARVSPERMIQLAAAWRLPEDAAVVMLPARLTRWKGHAVLIEALARVGHSDLRCLMVGGTETRAGYRAEMEALAARRGQGGAVRFVEHVSDMPAAYRLASVVVSASTDPEAFGRVIVEAQAMGRLVIAADHGASREIVVAGETGWLVPPGDPAALAEAIRHAITLPVAERQRMGEAARARAIAHFSSARMCAATLAVYRELLEPARA
ncbi:MAG: glycosyltransferase [Alphaproteobacteria bacterium]|nr:glycosyltransferase [Alphaproteobacteria bacterium]